MEMNKKSQLIKIGKGVAIKNKIITSKNRNKVNKIKMNKRRT